MFADGVVGLANLFANMGDWDDAALLYPGEGSQLLGSIAENERPKQLVVLDGTWHHTKTLFRDIPKLKRLKKVRLAPTEPSRYGIRREPHILFLSTLEATVAALRCLEPETKGFEQLVDAFYHMVESQLAHPKSAETVRRKLRPRAPLNIPKSLRNNLQDIVVLYAETAPHAGESVPTKETDRAPAYWVAERLVTGERFEHALSPISPLTHSYLAHVELTEREFERAISVDDFRERWRAFLRPSDTLTYYYSNCTRLLKFIGSTGHPMIYLKSIQLHRGQKNGEIEALLASLSVTRKEPHCQGRAGRRLACSIALAQHLATCDLVAHF